MSESLGEAYWENHRVKKSSLFAEHRLRVPLSPKAALVPEFPQERRCTISHNSVP